MHRIPFGWRVAAVFLALASLSEIAFAGTIPANTRDELLNARRRVRAAQFLSRATFGPTMAEIDALVADMQALGDTRAMEKWIDDQFALPASLHAPLSEQMAIDDGHAVNAPSVGISRYRDYAWFHNAIAAPDQLRQRMAWALSQIFVVNRDGQAFNNENHWLGLAIYYDIMVRNAFGNYRDVLGEVTASPIMGVFLSHLKNPKPNGELLPDENYAREIMQLFSIGLYRLLETGEFERDGDGNTIETYTNEDIKQFARVFTGFTYNFTDYTNNNKFNSPRDLQREMQMYEAQHDTDPKTLLDGTVLGPNRPGMDDVNDTLDHLFNHQNTGPFMARLLIQRLVKSNPSKAYIRRVSRAFAGGNGTPRGDFKAVLKAILLDREVLNVTRFGRSRGGLRVVTRGTEHSRLREPIIRYTQVVRAFRGNPIYPYVEGSDPPAESRFMIPVFNNLRDGTNQTPYRAPSVFNFYLPDYQPPTDILQYEASRRIPNGAIFAPEFQVATAVSMNKFANLIRGMVLSQRLNFGLRGVTSRIELNFSDEIALAGSDPRALVQHLDLLLCNASMSDQAVNLLTAAITEETTNSTTRAEGAILAVLTSPFCAISK